MHIGIPRVGNVYRVLKPWNFQLVVAWYSVSTAEELISVERSHAGEHPAASWPATLKSAFYLRRKPFTGTWSIPLWQPLADDVELSKQYKEVELHDRYRFFDWFHLPEDTYFKIAKLSIGNGHPAHDTILINIYKIGDILFKDTILLHLPIHAFHDDVEFENLGKA